MYSRKFNWIIGIIFDKKFRMHFVVSKTNNPVFNIAAEEYFLKNFEEDFFYLYINHPSLIVGKHQNTVAEINVPYVVENNIHVVRRLSGGGTVYHDAGNLNYCFIQKGKEGFLVDFKKYSQPILNALKKLGVDAYLRGKSDLVIDDLKFSGNAEHVFRKKVLHHGTLLFDSNLGHLNEAIKNNWDRFTDKAVRSNRSKVTNISNHLSEDITLNAFMDCIVKEVHDSSSDVMSYALSEKDRIQIQELIDTKYSKWDWNFGYSPKFVLSQRVDSQGEFYESDVQVQKGIIVECSILKNGKKMDELSSYIIGKEHNYFKFSDDLAQNSLAVDSAVLLKLLF